MKLATLFSGIGSPEFGAKRVYESIKNIFACEIDKFAREAYLSNHETKNFYKDIYDLDGTKYRGEVDVLVGGSPCFGEGTKVLSIDGYKSIENIKVGDHVLTHKGRYRKVLKIGNTKKKTIKIYAQGIKPTTTTINHPYYISEMNRKWDKRQNERIFSPMKWKNAGELVVGDFLSIPCINTNENKLNLTREECFILGRYVADGHTRKDYRVSDGRPNDRHWQLILSIGDNKVDSFKKEIIDNHFSCYQHTKSVHRIVFSNKRLVEIAEKYCGIGAINKKIHPIFLNLPKELLEAFLDGYMMGDGCKLKAGSFKATSISEDLILSISLAVAKVYNTNTSCLYTKRPKKHIIQGRVVNQHDTYSAVFYKKFKKQANAKFKNNLVLLPFKKTEKTATTEIVYNLEVEEDNSYTANNAIVHNCQSYSMSGKRKGINDPRGELIYEFIRVLDEVKPSIFIYENVRGFTSIDNGRTFKEFKQSLRDIGYYIHSDILNTKDYGVPQNRERIYIVGFLDSEVYYRFDYAKKQKLTKKLFDILEDDVEEKYYLSEKLINGFLRKKGAFAGSFNPHTVKDEVGKCITTKCGTRVTDPYIKVKSNTKKGYEVAKFGDYISLSNLNSTTRRGRVGKQVSQTIDTQANHAVYLDRVRKLTPRECLRLQDFPDSFKIVCSDSQTYKQAGNSMSANILEMIFRQIEKAKNNELKKITLF